VKSCLYRGMVRHERRAPERHAFAYRLFMVYLDLDELDEVFRGRWLWSTRRPNLAWFQRSDYHGDPDVPLARAVRDTAERLTGSRPSGPIRVLTHLRYFGYVMNPVTFYYCFDEGTERVTTILAEITNTPWNERHAYALTPGADGTATDVEHRFDKAFHVSPFMDMDHEYTWWFSEPDETLRVRMENHVDGDRLFGADLELTRSPLDGPSMASALAGYPLMTVRVVAAIYWQAFRLWLKRTPFHVHPAKRTA
jgi:DUF1365 family protein